MGTIQKIPFPYLINHSPVQSETPRIVVFFSTDFFNLPTDSNRNLFIERTNQALEYIRTQFPGRTLLYQAHPNEHDEQKYLDLEGFTIGEPTIAEVFLFEHAAEIEYVFSINSWASASAYLMGLSAAVLFEAFAGALSEETMEGTRGYYTGFQNSFFIRSFTQDIPAPQTPVSQDKEEESFRQISRAIQSPQKIWVMANEPSTALHAAIILRRLRAQGLRAHTVLLKPHHRRWRVIPDTSTVFDIFDESIEIPYQWYSARPMKIYTAIKTALLIRRLPVKEGDLFISSSHPYFHENCFLSYHHGVKKILFMESRWYNFTYGGEALRLKQREFFTPLGARFFNFVLEPLLGLYRTLYRQYADGRVLNIHRYRRSLEEIYDSIFVFLVVVK